MRSAADGSAAAASINIAAARASISARFDESTAYCFMKKSTQLPATWLVGRKVRLRPLETQDVPRLVRFGLAVDAKATPFIVQTHAGDDIGVLGFLIDGPQAAISVAFADRRSLISGYA